MKSTPKRYLQNIARKYQNIHKDVHKSKSSEGKRYQKYFKMHGFININVQYSNLFYNDLSI